MYYSMYTYSRLCFWGGWNGDSDDGTLEGTGKRLLWWYSPYRSVGIRKLLHLPSSFIIRRCTLLFMFYVDIVEVDVGIGILLRLLHLFCAVVGRMSLGEDLPRLQWEWGRKLRRRIAHMGKIWEDVFNNMASCFGFFSDYFSTTTWEASLELSSSNGTKEKELRVVCTKYSLR
jgi:hypothetical protein